MCVFFKGLLFIRKIIKWNEKTGFPHLPLMETTYVDTWQFFTELQNQLPEALVVDVNDKTIINT